MLFIPFSMLPIIAAVGIAIGLLRLFVWAAPKLLRATWRNFSLLPQERPVGSVTTGLARLNPLRIGQNAAPATSLNTVLLRTTLGFRLWTVALNLIFNYFIWIQAKDAFLPDTTAKMAISLVGAIAGFGLFIYEARLDDDQLTIRKWGLFHRQYLWRNLKSIKDDGHYEYILEFEGAKVRMPKHLVGIQGFLTFVSDVISGNQARNARTARS